MKILLTAWYWAEPRPKNTKPLQFSCFGCKLVTFRAERDRKECWHMFLKRFKIGFQKNETRCFLRSTGTLLPIVDQMWQKSSAASLTWSALACWNRLLTSWKFASAKIAFVKIACRYEPYQFQSRRASSLDQSTSRYLRNIEGQNKIHLACFFNKSHLAETQTAN